MKNSNVKKIAICSLFASFSLLLAFIGHYSVIPLFLGLKLDISSFPIFTSTLLFGSSYGYLILLVVSFIRSIFFSVAGFPGFIKRMTDIIPIFFLGLYHKKQKNIFLYTILSIVFSIIIKIPSSYIFWIYFNSMTLEQMNSLLFPVILPYNIVKVSINVLLSFLLYKKLKNIFKEKL